MIKHICVHHTGPIGKDPYSSSAGVSMTHIENAHKARMFNYSHMGYYTGYNFLITPVGLPIQTRKVGEMTCAATGHNFDTVHICISGNFTKKPDGTPVDRMTGAQKLTFISLVMALLQKGDSFVDANGAKRIIIYKDKDQVELKPYRIWPHRILQPNHTTCYGNYLDDFWARNFVLYRIAGEIGYLSRIRSSWAHLLTLLKRDQCGAEDKSCPGHL